jgi:hypothetical protein
MNDQQDLVQRRRELVERSAAQRTALLAVAAPIAEKAAKLDRIAGYVTRYPILSSAAVVTVALMGPRKIFDLGARAITLYTLFRR